MKKIFFMLCLIVLSFGFVGCDNSKISYAQSSAQIYENQEYVLSKDDIKITGKTKDYSVFSLDENIAYIRDFVVYPKASGTTKIRFKLNTKKDVHFDMDFEVKEGKIVKELSIEKTQIEINLSDESNTALNIIAFNEDANEVPVVLFDSQIVDYNYKTGVVTGLNPGQTVVTIKYMLCEVSFNVIVTKKIYPTLLSASDQEIFVGATGKFEFNIFPLDATVFRFWSESKDLIVERDGHYYFENPTYTKTLVKYEYYDGFKNPLKTGSFYVSIVDKVEDFDYEITDLYEKAPSNFLVGKTYLLTIKSTDDLDAKCFSFGSEIEIKSELQYVANKGLQTQIVFNNSDENSVLIRYSKTLGGVENTVNKVKTFAISSYDEIKVGVVVGSYNIDSYMITSNDAKLGISFVLKLNNELLNENLQVYKTWTQPNELLIGAFVPETVGEYAFDIYYQNRLLKTVTITVFNA